MQMTVKRDWQVIDAEGGKANTTTIPTGTHEIERIHNPFGYEGFWLVLKGTKIGKSEDSWRQWEPGQICAEETHPNYGKVIDGGDYEVVITE